MSLALAKFTKPVVMLTRKGIRLLSKNSNLVLTIISTTGVIFTTVCAIKGTIKAVKLCEIHKPQNAQEVIKTVWKCYIPTIGMVILTTTAIVSNGKINARRIAVLSSALAGSQNSLKYLQEKMAEEIGPKKAQKVIDKAKSEEAKQNLPENESEIIDAGNGGKNLFFLKDYGQWIRSSYDAVQLAEMKTTNDIQDSINGRGDEFVPANTALEHLGARTCLSGQYNGWRANDFDQYSHKGPIFHISSEWMEVNGENQIVGTIWFDPEPTPV
jgi:hypothetical protein